MSACVKDRICGTSTPRYKKGPSELMATPSTSKSTHASIVHHEGESRRMSPHPPCPSPQPLTPNSNHATNEMDLFPPHLSLPLFTVENQSLPNNNRCTAAAFLQFNAVPSPDCLVTDAANDICGDVPQSAAGHVGVAD